MSENSNSNNEQSANNKQEPKVHHTTSTLIPNKLKTEMRSSVMDELKQMSSQKPNPSFSTNMNYLPTQDRKTHAKSSFMKEVQKYYISETIKLSLITGPLYAFAGQYQYLSQHKSTLTRPFKYNSFETPFQLAQHMFKQGILGLYKGNFSRLLFTLSTAHIKRNIEINYYEKLNKMLPNKFIREVALYSLVDIILNPLLVMETRFLLQNRHSGFNQYENIISFISKSFSELYKGSLISIYRNALFIMGINLYFISPSIYMNWISIIVSHTISYPLLTIQRNIIARSSVINYCEKDLVTDSVSNKYLKIARISDIIEYSKTFGIVKLYRGYTCYMIAVGLWHYYVPTAAKHRYYKNIL